MLYIILSKTANSHPITAQNTLVTRAAVSADQSTQILLQISFGSCENGAVVGKVRSSSLATFFIKPAAVALRRV